MRLLFIGVACSEEALRRCADRYYSGRQDVRPQQHFDFALVKGLASSCDVAAISEPPVESFPRSSCLVYPPEMERISPTLSIRYLALLNLPLLKTFLVSLQVLLACLRFGLRIRGRPSAILLGYISAANALPALLVARALGTPIFAVVPDLPRLVAAYGTIRNPLRRLGLRAAAWLTGLVEPLFDGYVFLSGAMNEVINRRGRPHLVVEGMIDESRALSEAPPPKASRRTVMYAGTVHRRFGLDTLLEAFQHPDLAEVDLWIFGNGDFTDRVIEASASHPNVIYKGVVGRDEVFRHEQEATLLVNPRPSTDEFTRYSFPSKTLEYMVSGTPLVSTRLAGIPAEYDDHLFWFDQESGPGFARRISEILGQPGSDLARRGARARAFALGNKTAARQAARIVAFLQGHPGPGAPSGGSVASPDGTA